MVSAAVTNVVMLFPVMDGQRLRASVGAYWGQSKRTGTTAQSRARYCANLFPDPPLRRQVPSDLGVRLLSGGIRMLNPLRRESHFDAGSASLRAVEYELRTKRVAEHL